MTKSELAQKLSNRHPDLPQTDINRMVDVVFDEIATTLMEGGRVELRGFGAFSVRERKPRQGRNPRTGAAVKVPAKNVPFFKAGKELREKVNK
ncbi:MAG: integration host factor subunit beta [Alphaproteobacteria bacterium]